MGHHWDLEALSLAVLADILINQEAESCTTLLSHPAVTYFLLLTLSPKGSMLSLNSMKTMVGGERNLHSNQHTFLSCKFPLKYLYILALLSVSHH